MTVPSLVGFPLPHPPPREDEPPPRPPTPLPPTRLHRPLRRRMDALAAMARAGDRIRGELERAS